MSSAVALMLILVMSDGEERRAFIEQPSLEACFEAARKFVERSPADFKAFGLGAGCVTHPKGRPS